MNRIDVPVIVAGAGPAGLCMSLLLSRMGIRHAVLEKRERIGTLPRARGINVRSVEILTQLGLGEDLAEGSLGEPWTKQFLYTETLAGDVIGAMPGAMAPGTALAWSPCDYRVAAQDRLDPLLHAHAARSPLADIRLGCEVIGFMEDAEDVAVTTSGADGTVQEHRAQYLVAADGGASPLRTLAGIKQQGVENLRSFLNVHLQADLSAFTKGREATLIWTLAPGAEGVFQPLDGKLKWAVQVQIDPTRDPLESWTRERIVDRLCAMIGAPQAREVRYEILNVYAYTLSMMVAEQFRKGRLLLVGDAAHKIPPYGGFGLNTGIQGAHNLAWKLACVLRGEAPAALLDTYTAERREVAARTCAFGRTNAGYVEQMMGALRRSASLEERRAAFAASRQYGNWLGLDLGTHYETPGAFVPDTVEAPALQDPVTDYVPHAKPGWRAPHLWVRKDGRRQSLLSLFDSGFVLLAGPRGYAWIEAAGSLGVGPHVQAWRVGEGCELVPIDGDALALYGIGEDGAVLVRPDGHVAFRSEGAAEDAGGVLRGVMDRVLLRGEMAA